MLIDTRCPHCRDKVPVTESAGDQVIDCPGCGEQFTVPAAGGASAAHAPPKPRPADARRKAGPDSRRRRDDEDDDEDDRPRREGEGAASGMIGIFVAGGIGLFVLAAGFGLAAYLIFSKDEPAEADNRAQAGQKAPDNRAPPGQGPNIPGPVGPIGPGAGLPNRQPPDPGIAGRRPGLREPVRPKAPDVGPPTARAAPAVALPAAADQVVVGGGGKYLFLHLKAARQVAVFDPAAGKVVKFVPLADDDALIAAGLNHLLIAYPKQRLLARHPFATFERDKVMSVPTTKPTWAVHGIGMGSASNGPLLVGAGEHPWGGEFFLIDVLTMRRVPGSEIKDSGVQAERDVRIWAAPDGRAFTARAGAFGNPSAFQSRPTGWAKASIPFDPPLLGADGQTVYGNGQLATVGGQPVGEKRGGHGKAVWYVPAAQGPFFVSFNERAYGEWPKERKYPEVQIHAGRDARPLVTFPELPETAEFVDFFFGKTKPLDQHVFFLPFAKVLAILPAARDRIHLRPVDLKAELARSKTDYLLVASTPPAAIAGQAYRYSPDVWSSKGGVRLKLESGPAGLKLDGGAVTWDVPAAFNGAAANVILAVSDAGNQETFHTFEVPVYPAQ